MARRGASGDARAALACAALLAMLGAPASAESVDKPEGAVRVAAFNIHMAGGRRGGTIDLLREGTAPKIAVIAEILQRVRPDVVLLQELAYDPAGEALALFEAELAVGRNGADGIGYAHRFAAPVNTGVQSGFDLDRDGDAADDPDPDDAWGWGRFPGQFGMAILSTLPLDEAAARTFQDLSWADYIAGSGDLAEVWTVGADGGRAPYYPAEAWEVFPLSSKSHWDVPVELPNGERLHLLASHPAPPVFDGPEDRNGQRNRAEIGFWRAYLEGEGWITDDQGRPGGLAADAAFVVLGDLNNDPADGDGVKEAIQALLAHPKLLDPAQASLGGADAAARQGGRNAEHRGDPALDTADWRDTGSRAPGNLRVDYALPSRTLDILGGGVFWPPADDPLARLVSAVEVNGRLRPVGSDHRLVWVDIAVK